MGSATDMDGKIRPEALHLPYTVETLQALTEVVEMGLRAANEIDPDSTLGKWYGEVGIGMMRAVALDVIAQANKSRDDYRIAQSGNRSATKI
jgi:hypothetical protein